VTATKTQRLVCDRCQAIEGVKLEEDLYSPFQVLLCRECAKEHHEYLDAMADIYASLQG